KGVAEPMMRPLYGEVVPACPPPAIMMFEAYSDNIDFEEALIVSYLQPNNREFTTGLQEGYADYLLWNQHDNADLLWDHHYEIIGFLNSLIDQIPEIADLTPTQHDAFLGELYAHRAYSFFKLLQYFAPYDKADMGIPVYLHTGDGVVGIELPRSTQAEVYKVILNDLTQALEMVKKTPPIPRFSVFYNERYLHHILAQVYWFKAESAAKEATDYENVEKHATAAAATMDAYIPVTATERKEAYSGRRVDYPVVVQQDNQQGGISPIYGSEFQYFNGTYGPFNIP